LGSILLMRLAFSSVQLRLLLTHRLEEIVNRPVVMEEASISLFRGVRIKNLRIGSSSMPEASRDESLLTAELMIARFRWLPLMAGKLVLDRVELHAPEVTVTKGPDGW